MIEAAVFVIVWAMAVSALLKAVRVSYLSLGLPIAYAFSVLTTHAGCLAALATGSQSAHALVAEVQFATIGIAAFAIGVWIASALIGGRASEALRTADADPTAVGFWYSRAFFYFCLFGGWATVAILLISTSSAVSASIAGAVWTLGALLALGLALSRRAWVECMVWLVITGVYSVGSLIFSEATSFVYVAPLIVIAYPLLLVRRYSVALAAAFLLAFVILLLDQIFLSDLPGAATVQLDNSLGMQTTAYSLSGIIGVAGSIFPLGIAIGGLDLMAALAVRAGHLRRSILYFLPGVALIQPAASAFDLFVGVAVGIAAGLFWSLVWNLYSTCRQAAHNRQRLPPGRHISC